MSVKLSALVLGAVALFFAIGCRDDCRPVIHSTPQGPPVITNQCR